MKGWFITPNTGSPNRVSAISVPQAGMPAMKDLVPSIGSSTQTYSASGRSLPNSSPITPWAGKVRRISERIAVSAAWSAAVTGSNWSLPLSVTVSAVRKNGRMVSPETGRQLRPQRRRSRSPSWCFRTATRSPPDRTRLRPKHEMALVRDSNHLISQRNLSLVNRFHLQPICCTGSTALHIRMDN